MYLSRLVPELTSHSFRRDHGDLHQMHRTVMSGFPDLPDSDGARARHAVLWRLDRANAGYILYVQSRTRPDWGHLGAYLARPAETRELSTAFEALRPGKTLAFRLLANPTKRMSPQEQRDPGRKGGRRDNRYPILKAEDKIAWLVKRGSQNGFVIPSGANARPDVALTSSPRLTGRQTGQRANKITVDPVRFDGHLVVTDPETLADALIAGVGPAKSYGCGLLSLAPPRQGAADR
ncbi:type I-E CRISPR-associated protein Cas6/Cse3/CasE [Saccharomonospora sp. NPDC006951]